MTLDGVGRNVRSRSSNWLARQCRRQWRAKRDTGGTELHCTNDTKIRKGLAFSRLSNLRTSTFYASHANSRSLDVPRRLNQFSRAAWHRKQF